MLKEGGSNITPINISCSDSCSDSNDDEPSTVQEFEDYYDPQAIDLPGLDASNLATTVVKMSNSSNVEIKPVTQVTIHQYFRDSDKSGTSSNTIPTISEYCTKSTNNEAKHNEDSKPQATLNTSSKKFYHAIKTSLQWKLGIIFMLTIAIIVVVIVVYFTLVKEDDTYVRTNFSSVPEESEYDLGNDIHIFTRGRWGGEEIGEGWQNRSLVHPIKLVVIGHTVTPQCMTFEQCASRLQTMQSAHVGEYDYVDIGYNFLIGGDGNIYQALGWDIRNYLRIKTHSIQIQFIGSYTFHKVLERQKIGLQKLLDLGIKLGKIDKDYYLVAHNQVANTLSPGKNILTEIDQWPHYYNGTFT